MKRLTFVLVLACALVPGTARANSGTFWDWLYGLDPKLTGIGTDLHLACLTVDGKVIEHCEEAWGMRPAGSMRIADLKHEFDFRVAYFFEYGDSYPSTNAESIHAWKLMGIYRYRADQHISVGLGGGVMPFYGKGPDGTSFDSFTRGIWMPLSITYAPATTGGNFKKAFFIHTEASFITGGFSPGDFDNRLPKTESKGEWNVSVGAGFDLRRRFIGR
jgi:hypothetical protein